MTRVIIKLLITVGAWLAVLYPLWVRLQNMNWPMDRTLLLYLFPLFGLAAFSLLWLHAISGVFEPWLRRNFNFDRFVHYTASLILLCIIAHPLLLLLYFKFNFIPIFSAYGNLYIWIGIISWLLLITYDIGKALKKREFFARNWNAILLISNIGFILTFFHALALGDDLQTGPLRVVWLFYGVTAIAAIVYTYGIKRFLNRTAI